MIPLCVEQGLGIAFPEVINVLVHTFDLDPLSLIMGVCWLDAETWCWTWAMRRERGPEKSKPISAAESPQSTWGWTEGQIQDSGMGDKIFIEFLVHGNHPVNLNY